MRLFSGVSNKQFRRPGFWVPVGTTKAEFKENDDGTLELCVTIGKGRAKVCYHIKVVCENVFWEMDMPRR